MDSFKIVTFDKTYSDKIVGFVNELLEISSLSQRYNVVDLNEYIEKRSMSGIVIVCGDQVAGLCISCPDIDDQDSDFIEWLYVAEPYRRMHIGVTLVMESLKNSQANGKSSVFLETSVTNTKARAFYERIGFSEVTVEDDTVLYGVMIGIY